MREGGKEYFVAEVVSFQQINQILGLTDALDISREWVEIPLGTESPGVVRKLPNGKLEIIVDADVPFDQWLASLKESVRHVMAEQES